VRVLVIEDEERLAQNIAQGLREGASFAVDHAGDGDAGEDLARKGFYDLIILDLMLPGQSGLSLLGKLRVAGIATPVLILTAREEKESIVQLLNAGADDYLSKPFDLGELLARSKALIRRSQGKGDPILRVADVELNTLEQTVKRAGAALELSPTEYRILEYLMYRPRVIVSKQQLLEHLYDYNWQHHSNVIEAHMSNLRRKLDGNRLPALIETLRYRGYRLTVQRAVAS
jgi:two-component system response regulator PhoP